MEDVTYQINYPYGLFSVAYSVDLDQVESVTRKVFDVHYSRRQKGCHHRNSQPH